MCVTFFFFQEQQIECHESKVCFFRGGRGVCVCVCVWGGGGGGGGGGASVYIEEFVLPKHDYLDAHPTTYVNYV